MIISKSQGEKLSDKDLQSIYGGWGCGGVCGNCDCSSSGGDKFVAIYTPSFNEYIAVLTE